MGKLKKLAICINADQTLVVSNGLARQAWALQLGLARVLQQAVLLMAGAMSQAHHRIIVPSEVN